MTLSDGQIWKNGCKIAQIDIKDEISKAVIFNMCKDKLTFSKIMDLEDTQVLLDMGFKPTKQALVAKAK
jgi:hypothetical protein